MAVQSVINQAVVSYDSEVVKSNAVETQIKNPLLVQKAVDKTVASIGDTLSYTITIQNPSLMPFLNVTFTDTVDSHLNYITPSFKVNGVQKTPTISGQVISYVIDSIAANSNVVITFQARVAASN